MSKKKPAPARSKPLPIVPASYSIVPPYPLGTVWTNKYPSGTSPAVPISAQAARDPVQELKELCTQTLVVIDQLESLPERSVAWKGITKPLWCKWSELFRDIVPPEERDPHDAITARNAVNVMRRTLEALKPGPLAESPQPGKPPEQINPIAKAIAFLLDRRKATGRRPKMAEVTKSCGIGKTTLYDSPEFMAAWNAAKPQGSAIPHGEVDEDGNLDAWYKDDE